MRCLAKYSACFRLRSVLNRATIQRNVVGKERWTDGFRWTKLLRLPPVKLAGIVAVGDGEKGGGKREAVMEIGVDLLASTHDDVLGSAHDCAPVALRSRGGRPPVSLPVPAPFPLRSRSVPAK